MAHNRYHRNAINAAFSLFTFVSLSTSSAFACMGRPTAYPTASFDTAVTVSYSGSVAYGTVPVTVRFPPGFTGSCHTRFVLRPQPVTLTLQHTTNPQATLNYGITHTFWFTGDSFMTDVVGGPGQVIDLNIPFIIPANQTNKSSGTYTRYFNAKLINAINGGAYHDSAIILSAAVAPSCTLPPPNFSVVDFSSAVINGTIPAPFERTLSFSNAGCNGPARLTLSAPPLAKPQGNTPIHFSARAVLGSSTTILDTRIASSAIANPITAPEASLMPVTVTVLPTALPLQAGFYSSTLRVSLEPAQ